MNAIGPDAGLKAAEPVAAPRRRRLPPRGLLVLGAALLVGAGGYAYLHAARAATATDNAYVKTDVTVVAPRVRGHVAEVLVADNQPVKAGQLLVRLDPEEYAARVAAAQGDLDLADAAVAAAEAALVRLGSEEAAAAAQVREAETTIRAADAEATRAAADWTRYDALLKTGYAPRRDADRVQTQAVAAAAAADRSRAGLALSRSQLAATSSRRGELVAAIAQARAQREKAAAALDLARQDRDHAEIRAPVDGVVGDRQANVGDYVQPGARLLVLNPLDRLYVTANFKETQLTHVQPGQKVAVEVDTFPGVEIAGRVESLSPASGQEFALLPPDNATGNFTKIVQRIPVKIALQAPPALAGRLRPGMSVEAVIDTKPAGASFFGAFAAE